MVKKYLTALFLLLIAAAPQAFASVYAIDTDHTTIEFKIRHLFSWTKGTFNEYEGSFVYEPDAPEAWQVSADIQAASVDTHNAERDKHLRGKDFFDVENFPVMSFKSTSVTDVTRDAAKLHGQLTLHGVTRPVTLDVEIHGSGKDAWGNELAGFTAETKINRRDFGLSWSKTVESGQLLVGEEVFITIEVEGIKQEP